MFKFAYELFQTSGLSAQRDDFGLQSVCSKETEKEGTDVCYWKRGRVMSVLSGGGRFDLWFSLVPYGFHKSV